MAAAPASIRLGLERLGRAAVGLLEELGYAATLMLETLYWIVAGWRRRQPVRPAPVFAEMMEVGVRAIPIVSLLLFTIGVMLAIQGLASLKPFGAELRLIPGVALSVTREFAPLIVGILVAGRSGSALAARIGTMQVSQEIDALRVIGVNPVRYLVAPALLAMLVMLPALTVLGDVVGILGSALFATPVLDIDLYTYYLLTMEALEPFDLMQGLTKSLVFAILVVLIGASTGFAVAGGAEAVGRAATRAVVAAISAIILADMVFSYFLNR